jgi:hypothetical protein
MTIPNNPIQRLRELYLSSYPIDEIKKSIRDFGRFGIINLTLHEGKTIIRARPNEPDQTFSTISELSYKPPKFNIEFQRASTPNSTMFYGCVLPETIAKGDINNARVIAIFEASRLYRKGIENGEEKITFSRWTVIKDIPLVAIVYHKDFIKNSSYTNELFNAYQAALQMYPDDLIKSNSITEFLAAEFAKSETPNDYDYLISSLFTEAIIRDGFAGVYYPSVRAEGKGFNVAIHPSFVDNCMKPIVAGECTLYKKGKHVVLDNDTITEIESGQTNITFKPITDPQLHTGRNICQKILTGEIQV